MLYEYHWEKDTFFPFIRYYPCIKYKIPADPENDGTDTFIVAESMELGLSEITLGNSHIQVFQKIFR